MNQLRIIQLAEHHEQGWRALWRGYLDFYEADVDDRVTDNTWQMIVQQDSGLAAWGAELGGELVGFATVVVHPATWSVGPTAYLEDLFVRPQARGHGIGQALIRAVLDRGRERGWSSVYWHTKADNDRARLLYNQFANADDFVRYRVSLT